MTPQGRTKSGDKKQVILQAAKDLFSQKGFKDTNVPEITARAGIATGTFYLYFSSKEKLFMDLFLEENTKLKREIMDEINMDADPLEAIQQLMYVNYKAMSSNPILKEWYNTEVFLKIEEKYREEQGLEQLDFLYDNYVEVIQKWQAEGKFRSDIDTDMIMALFSVIINIDVHKEEIGLKFFPKIQDLLTEFIIKGLTPQAKK